MYIIVVTICRWLASLGTKLLKLLDYCIFIYPVSTCSDMTIDPCMCLLIRTNFNQEIFVVEIFSDSMANKKIYCTKIMLISNTNMVWDHLSKNYLTENTIF